jgi:hypothetical protein
MDILAVLAGEVWGGGGGSGAHFYKRAMLVFFLSSFTSYWLFGYAWPE